MIHALPIDANKRRRGRPPGSKTKAKPQSSPRAKLSVVVQEPVQPVRPAEVKSFPHRGRILIGVALGGFVPLASYTLVHVDGRREVWGLVAGGLLYSALTVYQWARRAFSYRAKAVGFVVLLEGVMTFTRVQWLGLAGLAILMGLNAWSAAESLQGEKG